MTDPKTADSHPEAPPPEVKVAEPWTAAKVIEWNAYYDKYVAVGVVLLAFFASANRIGQSSVWAHLQSGRAIAAGTSPTVDPFSYSQPDARWVHTSWLSDLGHFQLFRLAAGLLPSDPLTRGAADDPAAIEARRAHAASSEQWGAAALVALDAGLRALAVIALLFVRHRGPGLWWTALCVGVALAASYSPLGLQFGGIAVTAPIGSETWGQFLLAILVLFLFVGVERGRRWPFLATIPLFLLWANVDESFVLGLMIYGATVAGLLLRPGTGAKVDLPPGEVELGLPAPRRVSNRIALIGWGGSLVIGLINPSTTGAYLAGLASLLPFLGLSEAPISQGNLSLFSAGLLKIREFDVLRVYYLMVAGTGFMSFALNRARFSLPRFLAYTTAALLWAAAISHQFEFAVIFAATMALNGQEWYLTRLGREGRLGRGWAIWSTGGRAVTIGVAALLIFFAVTGFTRTAGEPLFGFGFDPGSFSFEAAEAVRDAGFKGNVLNTSYDQGDALVWRAYPTRKSFIDSRSHLFAGETHRKWEEFRKAIRDNDSAKWREILKPYDVSAVMLNALASPKTYRTLSENADWIPFFDDGQNVIFGRADAPADDLAYFRTHRLEVENLAYKNPTPAPSIDQPPLATSDLDRIYRSRSLTPSQSRVSAAARWLRPTTIAPDTAYLPDPGRCLLAIRECHIALSQQSNDTRAYGILADAYGLLFRQESALIAGIAPAPGNLDTVNRVAPQIGLLAVRARQAMTALNYAIISTPPPVDAPERKRLATLNSQLAEFYLRLGYLDLGRDRLQAAFDLSVPDTGAETLLEFTQQLNGLNAQVDEIKAQVANMKIETQANPVQQAEYARQNGAIGAAIAILAEAVDIGINPAAIKPTLVDLYCAIGQPDKAVELWNGGTSADRNLSDGPGTAAMREGRAFLLIGNYANALGIWNREALPELKVQRTLRAPQAVRALLDGDPMATARTLLELPPEVSKQAVWEFEIALASLEAGAPVDETAAHFESVLKLVPDAAVRPVVAYYLEKLGKPVPVDPNPEPASTTPAVAAPVGPAPLLGPK